MGGVNGRGVGGGSEDEVGAGDRARGTGGGRGGATQRKR